MSMASLISESRALKSQVLGGTLLAALLVSTLGCGGGNEPTAPVVPVAGKITFEGKAPAGAQIFLKPVSQLPGFTYTPVGVVKNDGTFAISTYGKDDGAPAGEYVAIVQWFKVVDGGRGPNILPPKYASPETSPIKVSVKEGGPNQVPPIEIVVR